MQRPNVLQQSRFASGDRRATDTRRLLAKPVAIVGIAVLWLAATPAFAVEKITFTDKQGERQMVAGKVEVEAQDGGVLLLADDGRLWTIQPEQVIERTTDSTPFAPIDSAEMQRRLLAEMPRGFQIHTTAHYVLCHNTSDRYVQWVGSLFEQLHRGFYAYWKNQGWDLPEAEFPLVGLVFADRESFQQYAKDELGNAVAGVIGYYNLETNRMTTYNMPNAERNVATIIHEATHQLAYNSGLQKRFADNPMWVSEGLAVFFEAPDFNSPRGWRTIGRTNIVNLQRFHRYLRNRPEDSLMTLLSDDSRFRRGATTTDAYAEAWALNYFLLKTRRNEYVEYLQRLSKGERLQACSPRDRLEMFEDAIGMTLEDLEPQFLSFMRRVR